MEEIMTKKVSFEILIFYKVNIKMDAKKLMYDIRGYHEFDWSETTEILDDKLTIRDKNTVIEVKEQSGLSTTTSDRSFVIRLYGKFDEIGVLRHYLINKYPSDRDRIKTYIIKDEVSEYIACQLYPHLYKVENKLRRYLIRFMTSRFSVDNWWKLSITDNLEEKTNKRRKDIPDKFQKSTTDVFRIDFNELGDFVTKTSSGFITKDQIIDSVMKLKANDELGLKDLQEGLKPNYQKFFQKAFAKNEFQKKWDEFEKLRHRIAHTSIFELLELGIGLKLAGEIEKIIDDADNNIDETEITEKDRDDVVERLIDLTEDNDIESNENEQNITLESLPDEKSFLDQLSIIESRYGPNSFVGLKRFLNYHLPEAGISAESGRQIFEKLKKNGVVEIYKVPNPNDTYSLTTAIRYCKREEDQTPKN